MPDVICPKCGRTKAVTDDKYASISGKAVRCSGCKADFIVEERDPLDFLKDVPPPVASELSLPTSPAQQQPIQFKASTGFMIGLLLRRALKTITERVMWGTVGLFLGVMIGSTVTLMLMRDSGPRLWPGGDISGPGPKRPLTKEEFIDQRVMTWVIENRLDGEAVDEEIMRKVIREKVEKYGTETHDYHGYPLYGKRPWELPDPVFSWNQGQGPYLVRPAVEQSSFFKSFPDCEHRYVDLVMLGVSDKALIQREATKVYRHFRAEVNARHPQASAKLVIVNVYTDAIRSPDIQPGDELKYSVARVGSDTAVDALPFEPEFKWWVD